ncbi:hypothetical protein KRMM14A1004_49880 [Krasilnikovia sp. MM14-A1004]
MSLFFDFYGEVGLSTPEIPDVIASAIAGSVSASGTIHREGMDIEAHAVAGEEDSTGRHFGFDERVTAAFTFGNRASPGIRDHNTVLMVVAVLAVFDHAPGRGVLLANGSRAIVQRLGKKIEFDAGWEDWTEIAGARPVVARHAVRTLPQPLL